MGDLRDDYYRCEECDALVYKTAAHVCSYSQEQLDRAVRDEREACAKACEGLIDEDDTLVKRNAMLRVTARIIRARGGEGEG